MAVTAVITARGGSKRIPRKNLRPFCGVPVIVRTLETVVASSLFDEIFVSSEDDEILAVTQSQVPPMPWAMIRKQVEKELGKPPEKLFATFEQEAFAAASLGFPILVIVLDVTENLGKYLQRKLPPLDIAQAYVYGVPETMFLVLPVMLRHGIGFYVALGLNCLLTALLYLAMVRIGGYFGLKL